MGKLRQIIRDWIDRVIEKSVQRQADRLFDKAKIEYRDGDNT